MIKEELRELILDKINKDGNISFVGIENIFRTRGLDFRGEYAMTCPEYNHIILWLGWKREYLDFVGKMCKEKLIEIEPCNRLVYMIDGGIIRHAIGRENVSI